MRGPAGNILAALTLRTQTLSVKGSQPGARMPETEATVRQWSLIHRWLTDLKKIPALDLVWLEGSLADGRGSPYSDIDIRFAIADDEFELLWQRPMQEANAASDPLKARGPTALLAGLGDYLLLETTFVRALTSDGLLVEAGAVPTSQAGGKALFEWEILFSRLPDGAPAFRKSPMLPAHKVWPEREPLTPASVWQRTKFLHLMMLHTPAVFHNEELQSVLISLDLARNDLLKLMWRRAGLSFGKRAKHMSEIFPPSWLTALNHTYPTDPTVLPTLAAPLLRIYALQAEHLRELSAAAGGGFPVNWFERQFAWLTRELDSILGDSGEDFQQWRVEMPVG